MSSVSAPTDVFGLSAGQKSVVLGLSRRRARGNGAAEVDGQRILDAIATLADDDWTLSVAGMFGDHEQPAMYQTGAGSDMDFVTAFEAPTLSSAFAGIETLASAGWDKLFRTTWLVGRREFISIPTPHRVAGGEPWAMFALWEWNDAWQAATPAERAEYDAECDEAFQFDLRCGVSIAGRHRMDHASSWHHLGIWEAPTYEVVDRAMVMHERVADFKFTTSRHYLGQRQSLNDNLIGAHQ